MDREIKHKLRHWFESLNQSKQIDIALECIEELILTKSINFHKETKVPYWYATGDSLDGSEFNDERK